MNVSKPSSGLYDELGLTQLDIAAENLDAQATKRGERMVRALGIGFLLVGLAASMAVGQVAGFVHTQFDIEFDEPWLDALRLDFEIGFEYSVSEWSFGTLIDVEDDGLEDLAFSARGVLGAFNVYSRYWIAALDGETPIPGDDLWADWDNAVWTTMAGVDIWAFFSVLELNFLGDVASGAGLALGAHGVAGDVEIWAEMQFNLYPMLPFIYWNGFDTTLGKNLACDFIDVIDPTCSLDVSFVEFYFDFPFCCADVGSWLGFDPDGFYGFETWIQHLDLGFAGLSIEWFSLWFEMEYKEWALELDFAVGEFVCIQPYASLVLDSPVDVAGFEIDGISLTCELGNVKVTVSELLIDDDYFIGIDGAIHEWWDPAHEWIIGADCIDEAFGIEEAIAIEIGGDSCCGGDTFIGLYNFFDIDLNDSLFDWLGLRARFEFAVSPLVTFNMETWIWYDGWESIAFGFDMAWGILDIITSDLTCCQVWF